MLTTIRTMRPGGSSESQRVMTPVSGRQTASSARTRWAAATGGSSLGRSRFEGISAAIAAASRGITIRATDIGLLLQCRQPAGVQRRKFAVDVMDDNADDKHTDQKVE